MSLGFIFQVMYLGEKQVFTPVQLATMLFTKLKHTAETAMKTKVIDVVVSVSFKMLLSNVEQCRVTM